MSDKFTRFEKPTSNQDFFNKAWQWLVVENRPKCTNNNPIWPGCLYREINADESEKLNGHSCIIGAFIPDSLVAGLAGDVTVICTLPQIKTIFEHVNMSLMKDVQSVHDSPEYHFSSSSREKIMKNLAVKYELEIPEEKSKL